ncbi:MAG: YibE/F family protein [Patescibacteria group bacterium]|mgnify:CR=1 FL=1
MKKIIYLFVFLTYFFFVQTVLAASQQNYEGVVTKILEDKTIEVSPGVNQPYQKAEVEITNHDLKGKKVVAELGGMVVTNENLKAKPGDNVMITQIKKVDGSEQFFISDFVRRDSLYFLAIIFFILVIIVGGIRGFTSFIGLTISFAVLIKYIIPQIVGGANPVFIAISGSFIILITTLYLAHGISKKTTAAVLGTIISLIITGLLAWVFVNVSRLSGFGSEEASFLSMLPGVKVNLQGILLAGIIIGSLGVLDDITVSQAACVFELHQANKNLTWKDLYKSGQRIGQDHIASLVNTLVLAYVGVSLPLLLLFAFSGGEPASVLLNREMIANEIVRTLVGSIGLVTAVPITTAIAASFSIKKQ